MTDEQKDDNQLSETLDEAVDKELDKLDEEQPQEEPSTSESQADQSQPETDSEKTEQTGEESADAEEPVGDERLDKHPRFRELIEQKNEAQRALEEERKRLDKSQTMIQELLKSKDHQKPASKELSDQIAEEMGIDLKNATPEQIADYKRSTSFIEKVVEKRVSDIVNPLKTKLDSVESARSAEEGLIKVREESRKHGFDFEKGEPLPDSEFEWIPMKASHQTSSISALSTRPSEP